MKPYASIMLVAFVLSIWSCASQAADQSGWSRSDEKALRNLIATSEVIISTYFDEKVGLPLRRMEVPDSFVELYRKDPTSSLAVLLDIVDRGNPHDAIVAFHFANAGDEPQIALPFLHYLNDSLLECPFGGKETYRRFCVNSVKKQLLEAEKEEK